MDTKEKIITTALSLFNEYGYGAVTMRQIADNIGVDRRNITYHYSKEDILEVISTQLSTEMNQYRVHKRDIPSFDNLDRGVILFNNLQLQYAFIFKDLTVIQHSLIKSRYQAFCQDLVTDSQEAIAFAIEQGNMKTEEIPGSYHAICEAVLTISISWLQLQILRDIKDLDQCRKLIWSLIVPHFTAKGVASFRSYFGNDFYNNLGKPFEIKLNTILF